MLLLYPYGIHTMVCAYVALTILWMFIWYGLAYCFIGYKPWDFFKDVCPFVLVALGVMVVVHLVTMGIENLPLLLLARVVLAAGLYYAVMRIAKVKILDECLNFVLKRKK